MTKSRDSFIFYRSFFESTLPLDKEQKAELFDAICNYALDGKLIPINGIAKGFFTLIKPQLDANRKKWENGCKEKSKKEVEQEESKSEAKHKQEESKSEGNVNVNVNVECKSELESKFKLKIINKEYTILADGLIFVLEAKMNKKLPAGSQKSYAEELRKLIEIDLKERMSAEEDVKRAIQAIGANYGKDYFPVIQSGGSFREKFIKIEAYLERISKSNLNQNQNFYNHFNDKYNNL